MNKQKAQLIQQFAEMYMRLYYSNQGLEIFYMRELSTEQLQERVEDLEYLIKLRRL